MRIEIKEVDAEKGITRITTLDERWYVKDEKFVPSVTWIAGFYPKGIAFYKWLAEKGWDESQAIKSAAGDKGSKVHNAIEDLLSGKELKMEDKYLNPSTREPEELTVEEWEAIMSFQSWWETTKPELISKEFVVFSDKNNYAGTVDLLCKIDGRVWLIDFKTGQSIWPEYELQVSAYKHAIEESRKDEFVEEIGILQIGYRRNKNMYKLTQIEDKFDLFLSAQSIWANECKDIEPKQKDFPLTLKLSLKK